MGLANFAKFVAGVILHRAPGKSYPYVVPFTAAQLVQPYGGTTGGSTPLAINFAPVLPAGSIIEINGQFYRTDRDFQAGQLGSITPLMLHPSVIGPKDTSTFTDRQPVYWNATTNAFTSVATGNAFVGYAVANPQLGSATQSATSVINITPTSTAPIGTAVCSVTGGTSLDNLAGTYASGDTQVEVECVSVYTGTLANVVEISDPGNGGVISVAASGVCQLTIASTADSRYLPAPSFAGETITVAVLTSGTSSSGSCALYTGSTTAHAGPLFDGTNDVDTVTAVGQAIKLSAIPASATTFRWMLDAKLGGTLST
jgi:hypothetical protein